MLFRKLGLAIATIPAAVVQAGLFTRGQDFQIVLSGVVDVAKPLVPDVPVYDVDLYETPTEVIQGLRAKGKIVICYFSAGTYEDWRPDANQFAKGDLGNDLDDWPGEKWLNIRSLNVRRIMTARVKLAAQKGCQAIDPDNTDVSDNDNGKSITRADVVDFIKFLAKAATTYKMEIGLKNTLGMIDDVASLMSFAVNEACHDYNECNLYNSFLASGKPVFHIEYPSDSPTVTSVEQARFCKDASMPIRMSTVMKNWNLDGFIKYCNSQTYETETATPDDALKNVLALSPPLIAACSVKLGAKCGGTGWGGCTTCASGSTCQSLSRLISICK